MSDGSHVGTHYKTFIWVIVHDNSSTCNEDIHRVHVDTMRLLSWVETKYIKSWTIHVDNMNMFIETIDTTQLYLYRF